MSRFHLVWTIDGAMRVVMEGVRSRVCASAFAGLRRFGALAVLQTQSGGHEARAGISFELEAEAPGRDDRVGRRGLARRVLAALRFRSVEPLMSDAGLAT